MSIELNWESKTLLYIHYSGAISGEDVLNSQGKMSGDRRFDDIRGVLIDASNVEQNLATKSDVEEIGLRKLLEITRRLSALTSIEHEQNVQNELDEVYRQEELCRDLIESEEWYFLDESGKKRLIIAPVLHEDNGITWRWNFR